MARIVATKAANCIRVDALTDTNSKSANSIGVENRAKLERRLLDLESQVDFGGIRSQGINNAKKAQKIRAFRNPRFFD